MSVPSRLLPEHVTWEEWARLFSDLDIWEPAVRRAWELSPRPARMTGMASPQHVETGFPGTCAVFVVNKQAVVKFFPPFAHEDFRRERFVLEHWPGRMDLIPQLWAAGTLPDRIDWPFLIMRYEAGWAWRELQDDLAPGGQLAISAELGQAIRSCHQWPLDDGRNWPSTQGWVDLVEARLRDGPADLVRLTELPDFVIADAAVALRDFDWFENSPCLVHADLTEDHILAERVSGHWRLSSIIDWADAEVADPTYELVVLWPGFCGRDPQLLQSFLAAYDPDVTLDTAFVKRLLAFTLIHRFGPHIIADNLSLGEQRACDSLETLARHLFRGLV